MVQKSIDNPSVGQYLNCLEYLLYLRRKYSKSTGQVPVSLLEVLKMLELNPPAFVPNLTKLINDRYSK